MSEKPAKIERQLIEAIRASRLTQLELAKLSGVDQGTLSRFLSEEMESRRTLSLPTADKLCRVLGLELVQTQTSMHLERAKRRKEK